MAKLPAWAKDLLRAAAATALVGLVFGRAVGFQFLLWDDDIQITHNPTLRQLDGATAWRMFTHGYAIRYQPLSWLSSALLVRIAGFSPAVFHAYNIALHATSTLLLAAWIRRLLARGGCDRDATPWAATFGALVWAVHPLRVEPVVWATGWRYCQSVVLLLASALLYLRATESPGSLLRTGRYWLSVFAFALSAFSYPFCLEWPLVLLLLDVYPLRRWRAPSAWLDKLPFAAISAFLLTVSIVVRVTTRVEPYQPATLAQYGPLARIMKAFVVWANAVRRTLWPGDLGPIYTDLLDLRPGSRQAIAALVLMLAITLLLVRARRRLPLLTVLWLAHLALLLTKLGLLDVHHIDADRYTYPAGIVWAVLVAAGFAALARYPALRRARAALALAVLGVFGLDSYGQTAIWRNDRSFFPSMLATVDRPDLRADLLWRLALSAWRQGQRAPALSLLDQAIAVQPTDGHARLARIRLLHELGHTDAAYRDMAELMRMTGAATAEEASRIIADVVRDSATGLRD